MYEPSPKQAADIYTKSFDNAAKWELAGNNIAVVNKDTFDLFALNKHINSSPYDDPDLWSMHCNGDNTELSSTSAGYAFPAQSRSGGYASTDQDQKGQRK